MTERIVAKINPEGCSLLHLPNALRAIAIAFPNAKFRQENGWWIIFLEEVKE